MNEVENREQGTKGRVLKTNTKPPKTIKVNQCRRHPVFRFQFPSSPFTNKNPTSTQKVNILLHPKNLKVYICNLLLKIESFIDIFKSLIAQIITEKELITH